MDELLLEWLESTPGIPRRERQALLLKELMAVHAMRGLAPDPTSNESSSAAVPGREEGMHSDARLAEREAKLCSALRNTLLEVVDVAEARRVSEALSVSTDLDLLYSALDSRCVMTLRVSGDGVHRPPVLLRGLDDIINELSEFQESVLLLRVDSSTSPVRSHNSHAAVPSIAVRAVSAVQSWTVRCEVDVETGTQVSYYADADRTKALFDLRSAFIFSADGTKVEGITRELLPRGGHSVDDLLRVLHFGQAPLSD